MTLKKIIYTFAGFIICSWCQAQLSVSTSMSASQLVQNVLLGAGVTVSNVSYTGSSISRGNFTGGGSTNLGLSDGVVLATCNVIGANGVPPLGSPVGNFANEDMGQNGDPDLEALLNNTTTSYDASVLQFDFVPLADTIKFRYVFGSEEYPEYVCSQFNDVFGFFLSGPGISGPYSNNSKNIALIPGTNLPVAINTVNQGNLNLSYPSADCQSLSYSNYFVYNENMGGTTIVFDGFTTVLTAWAVVQPCQQYHIKLAVCDLGDANYDSGVFLEAGSFSSTSVTVASATTNTNIATDTTAVEGCSGNILTFTRSGSTSASLTVPITVSGTATNGVDYVSLPSSVTFSSGQSTTTLTVDPINDGIPEGDETVIVTVPQVVACASYEPKVTIHIYDPNPISLSIMNDTSIICPMAFDVEANATGGNGNLSYIWGNGLGTNNSIYVTPYSTTTYIVTVSDACGQEEIGDVTITMPQYNLIQISASPDPTICSGDYVTLTASASGGIGYFTFLWSDPQGTIGNSVTVNPTQTTVYTVSVTDSCGIVATANITVNILPVVADFNYSYVANEIIDFQNTSVNGVIFQWDFGDGEQSSDENPTHTYSDTGMYVVTLIVTNSSGCIDSIQKEIIVYPPFHVYIPNAFTPDDNGLNDYFAPIAVGVIKTEMEIYDRWGCIMFHSEENDPKWDGRDSKNDRVQVGVYVYLLHYLTPTGVSHACTGTVTLLR